MEADDERLAIFEVPAQSIQSGRIDIRGGDLDGVGANSGSFSVARGLPDLHEPPRKFPGKFDFGGAEALR